MVDQEKLTDDALSEDIPLSTLSVWHHLPPEIVSKIFVYKYYESQSKQKELTPPQYIELYTILLVCRWWYLVAIGCPYLWSYISSSLTAEHTKIFLYRSKQVPIWVQPTCLLNLPQVQDISSLRLILQEYHRIKSLHILITWDVAEVLADLYPPLSSPFIQTLSIDKRILDTHNEHENYESIAASVLSLPFPFQPSPHLSILHISGYTLGDIRHMFRPTLRELYLLLYDEQEDESGSDIAPSVDEILSLLGEMPLLEKVDIPTWLDNPVQLPRNFGNIALQNLRILKLQLNKPDASFLKHITFSPGVQLHLSAQCYVLDGEAFLNVFEPCTFACGFSTPGSAAVTVRSLDIHQSPHWTFTIKCWVVNVDFDIMWPSTQINNDDSPILELDFEYHVGIMIPEIYSVIPQCLDTSGIETLALSLAPGSDGQLAKRISRIIHLSYKMEKLHTLITSQWSLHQLYQLIYGSEELYNQGTKLPALKTIYAPHLPTMLPIDWESLGSILEDATPASDRTMTLHLWKDALNGQSSRTQLGNTNLQSQVRNTLFLHDEKLNDPDYAWYATPVTPIPRDH